MNALHRFHSTSTPLPHPPQPVRLARAVGLLHTLASHEPLQMEGPWRLGEASCRALEREHGPLPCGSWEALAGILAGTGVLHITPLAAEVGPEDPTCWDEPELRQRAFEALTCLLVPPAVAAGWFLAVGIHPYWGLKVAHHVHGHDSSCRIRPSQGEFPEHLFDPKRLEALLEYVFGGLARMGAVLLECVPGRAYSLRALAEVCSSHLERHRARLADETSGASGLPMWMPQDGPESRLEHLEAFVRKDLCARLLEPAGIVYQPRPDTFAVWEGSVPSRAEVFGQGRLCAARERLEDPPQVA